ncbi:MAG: DNA recombination protein RmuC [Chloroflexi bacterium]|nr:MAG: DNA recombination protein RmuC [Chloroflexota bacterium]
MAQTLASLQAAVQGVETRVVESSAGVRDVIGRELQEARVLVERIKADGEARRRMEEEVQASARRIESVLLGSRSRGAAGENILQDAFREFPPDMIETNYRVNGKVVEYALVLANARRLPIDSKWPSPELLDRLGQDSGEPSQGAALAAEVERVLRRGRGSRPGLQRLPPGAPGSLPRGRHPDAVQHDGALCPGSLPPPPAIRPFDRPGEPGGLSASDGRRPDRARPLPGEQHLAGQHHDPERLRRLQAHGRSDARSPGGAARPTRRLGLRPGAPPGVRPGGRSGRWRPAAGRRSQPQPALAGRRRQRQRPPWPLRRTSGSKRSVGAGPTSGPAERGPLSRPPPASCCGSAPARPDR